MDKFRTGYFEGLPQPRMQGTRVTLAGRTAFLPNRRVPMVVQKLTLRQIAEIPRDKYAVAIIEPEAMPTFDRRNLRNNRNIQRHRVLACNRRISGNGDLTQEFTTAITLLHRVHQHVETIYYESRKLSRNNNDTPPPGGDIFLVPVDAGKMSDCIKKIVLDIFGNDDKGKICDRDTKLVEFCLLMHYYFIRIKILKNTSRQPFCEYLENYVFKNESRFTAKTFNNHAEKHEKAEKDFTNAERLDINYKKQHQTIVRLCKSAI